MHLRLILVFILLPFSISSLIAQNIARQTILEDLKFLNQSLRASHYDLFAYTSETIFENNYQQLKASVIKDSMSQKDVIGLFQKVIAKANTGHAEINFPVAAYRTYGAEGGTVFPLELVFEDGQALIRKNFSNQEALKVGHSILAIDGVPIKDILEAIYPHISAETTYFKNAKLELWSFPRLYWQVFGQQKAYEITLETPRGISTYRVPAVRLYEDFEMKRAELSNPNRSLKYFDKTAYLKPGNFSGDEQQYQYFIDSTFADIATKGSDNLIIDLRNNLGGDNFFSDYLISYFANKNFKWHSQFRLKSSEILKAHTRSKNDTTKAYFKAILNHPNGTSYPYLFDSTGPQNTDKRFHGEVYVLVNRHSYSMAAVMAATVQDYDFGTIVGETTGDWPSLHASQFQYTLPNTGVVVKVPKGYMVRPNGREAFQGVVPDIFIKDHLIDEKDEIMEALLKRL